VFAMFDTRRRSLAHPMVRTVAEARDRETAVPLFHLSSKILGETIAPDWLAPCRQPRGLGSLSRRSAGPWGPPVNGRQLMLRAATPGRTATGPCLRC
jgi:hypothetical protein